MMKLTKLIVLLVLLTITLSAEATGTKPNDDYCDAMHDTCRALQSDTLGWCKANGGLDCFCESIRVYNNCMGNWGCNGFSQHQMMEMGCQQQ